MALLTFLYLLFISLFLQKQTAAHTCPTSCPGGGPEVNFPFGLNPNGNQTGRCSYPGFDLACSNQTQELIINLPESGQFIVRYIDYESQQIWIDDPDLCLPRRFLNSFNISGTAFDSEFWFTFTFFNCSATAIEAAEGGLRSIPCLSDQNYSLVASQTVSVYSTDVLQSACRPIRTVTVPFIWSSWWDGVRLEWNKPDCRSCIQSRGDCRFKNKRNLEMGCFNLPSQGGLPRSAKYGIIIGVGIPGILSLIGLVAFVGSRVRTNGRRRNLPSLEFAASISLSPAVVITGLDGQTIESYPKTKLGESGRLPKPNDNICPICLSEYEPKEILRTIPECNHYFHVNCIDEWLKVNASCPLCRNSPSGSDDVTPSIASSSSSPSSLLSP